MLTARQKWYETGGDYRAYLYFITSPDYAWYRQQNTMRSDAYAVSVKLVDNYIKMYRTTKKWLIYWRAVRFAQAQAGRRPGYWFTWG